ncbi:MAG TPA: MlaD family protein [Thermoleophilaceae bacterium]|nr:MlaD family protein [Thermoleophilaceae bacterium]
MRRWLLAFALSVAVGALIASSSGRNDGAYRVRAVFDNASFVIPGEDVKIAGVKVGVIDRLDLTRDNKAAVVLRIDDPAFRPFRGDATCHVGLQSLIGEQFVECVPTQPRGPGVQPAPPLREIKSGPGKGEHLLPVTNTVTPVNLDLIANIMRVPERERFRLIINELGAGLAGNGTELRKALRRANPALRKTDQVISVLARQNRTLARLVSESDQVLGPLAAHRRQLTGFITKSGKTAEATAARGADLERDLQKLPPFLEKLGPAADDFAALADEATPALQSLNSHSDTINKTVQRLGPTASKATPALVALGKTAESAGSVFPQLEPTTHKLTGLARPLLPLSTDLADLSSSFDKTGGIEDVMRFIYFYTGALNGEDALGHYVRASLQVSVCSGRVSKAAPGCESNFARTSGAKVAAATAQDQLLNFLMGKGAK